MTQLTTTTNNQLATPSTAQMIESFGINPSDVQLGHIVLAQDNSKGLKTVISSVKPGDICDLLNKSVIGGLNKEVLFIPIKHTPAWAMVDLNTNRKIKTLPVTPENASWKHGDVKELEVQHESGGLIKVKTKATTVHNWSVLLLDQAKDGFAILYNLAIKGMSYPAHKTLTSFVMLSLGAKLQPFEKVYALSSVMGKNAKGEFYVYQIKQHSKTPIEVMDNVLYWADAVITKKVNVAEDVSVEE